MSARRWAGRLVKVMVLSFVVSLVATQRNRRHSGVGVFRLLTVLSRCLVRTQRWVLLTGLALSVRYGRRDIRGVAPSAGVSLSDDDVWPCIATGWRGGQRRWLLRQVGQVFVSASHDGLRT